jgi:hypothetical protein
MMVVLAELVMLVFLMVSSIRLVWRATPVQSIWLPSIQSSTGMMTDSLADMEMTSPHPVKTFPAM